MPPMRVLSNDVRIWKFSNPDPIGNFFMELHIHNPYPKIKKLWAPISHPYPLTQVDISLDEGSVYAFYASTKQ